MMGAAREFELEINHIRYAKKSCPIPPPERFGQAGQLTIIVSSDKKIKRRKRLTYPSDNRETEPMVVN